MGIVRGRRDASVGIVRMLLLAIAAIAGGVPTLSMVGVHAAPTSGIGAASTPLAESAESVTFRIYATREGLVGGTTSSGHVITQNDHFVALPSPKVLNKNVRITYKGKSAIAPALDVGPWNNDDNYWDPPNLRTYKNLPRGVPQAQDAYQNGTNGGKSGLGLQVTVPCGIDIGDGTWADLGLSNPDWVTITFLWMTDDPAAAANAPAAPPKAAQVAKGGFDLSNLPVVDASGSPPLDRVSTFGKGFTFVPQTGHTMPDVIAQYWNSQGGVNALGYPLSEVFIRKSSSEQHIYQYFERVLVEYLPDSNSVTLAPLGAWFADDNGPYDTVTAFDSTTKKRYVSATGHGVGGGILQWYAANGDAAKFGNPLSEEMPFTTSDGRKVTAQLFERARIEMDASGAVTLGRLGAEWLQHRGWL